MKAVLQGILMALTVASQAGFASTGFVGVDLLVRFAYSDLNLCCRTTVPTLGANPVEGAVGSRLFLFATVKDEKVVQARLSQFREARRAHHGIDFVGEELNGLEVDIDPAGNYYVTALPLSARLLDWVAKSVAPFDCAPSKPLSTLGPNSYTYHFKTERLQYYSEVVRFHGSLADRRPFAMKLGFVQRQIDQ